MPESEDMAKLVTHHAFNVILPVARVTGTALPVPAQTHEQIAIPVRTVLQQIGNTKHTVITVVGPYHYLVSIIYGSAPVLVPAVCKTEIIVLNTVPRACAPYESTVIPAFVIYIGIGVHHGRQVIAAEWCVPGRP